MADRSMATVVRFEPVSPERRSSVERRSGHDRRSGRDRRAVDLLGEIGGRGFDLRSGAERRSGRDRRPSAARPSVPEVRPSATEIVTPWQIAEARPG